MISSRRVLGALVIVYVLFFAGQAFPQQLSLSGTVRDADGVVPKAEVTLYPGGDEPKSTTTDDGGRYRFDGLKPGYYEMSFFREGFDVATRNITLTPDVGSMDVMLTLGAISTAVTITDVAGKATSSRLEIPDRELPVQVSTISQQLLQQQGVNDMATALRNVSGVQAQVLYGVYEQYTIRGFNAKDAMLVDGMRTEAILNRQNTQLNNVESIEVLKGPSSALYGGDAVGGVVNIIRKKPQGRRAYDFLYKGGRFNSHQVAGGATGPLAGYGWLYRVDASYSNSDGWRDAGADRLNVSPSLTWLMSERARVTVHQTFNRDDFKGDGGVAAGLITSPLYKPSQRFSIPDDFALIKDSQTQVLFNGNLTPRWEFRNAFLMRRTSEEYFVTEGVYFDPATNTVPREGLYFHHHRRPYVNQAELVGRVDLGGIRHTLLAGYDYRHFFTRTDVTEDGGFYVHTDFDLTNPIETNPRISEFPIVRETYQTNRIHGLFWQDHIDLFSKLKVTVGGRFDDYDRDRYRVFTEDPGTRTGVQTRHQTAYTYRAGAVFAPAGLHQFYFSANSSFTPVTDVPADGSELKPQTGRGYEAGYRWQGWDERIQANVGVYHIENNNLTFSDGLVSVVQAGKQSSKGVDVDVKADLGGRIQMVANYGYTMPKFEEFVNDDFDYSGKLPRFAQKHAANLWLTKGWFAGLSTSVGVRYVGPIFTDNENTVRLGGWTTFSGAVSYRREFWELSVNAENLLDRKRYFLPTDYSNQVYSGAPISVSSSIRFRLQ